jgi:activator of HSP90 ATPase
LTQSFPNIIEQHIAFPGVPAAELFSTYITPSKHSAAIQSEAKISAEAGAPFSAFGENGLSGRMLFVDPGRTIVQTWRANVWSKDDPDSILVLNFIDQPDGGAIQLIHANVSPQYRDHIAQGWDKMYWQRWRGHLSK